MTEAGERLGESISDGKPGGCVELERVPKQNGVQEQRKRAPGGEVESESLPGHDGIQKHQTEGQVEK